MARDGEAFKKKVLAKLLPPNTASIEEVSREVGLSVDALERWRAEALSTLARERAWSAAACFNAVLTTAPMDAVTRNAWWHEHGLLAAWRDSATQALADPKAKRASPKPTAADRRRIKQLERELNRKDKALAETAALLVPSTTRGDLPQGRRRMIRLEDRKRTAQWRATAHRDGARLHMACEVAVVDVRTLQRWKAQYGLEAGDRRPDAVRPERQVSNRVL
jgi:hypothetical protein